MITVETIAYVLFAFVLGGTVASLIVCVLERRSEQRRDAFKARLDKEGMDEWNRWIHQAVVHNRTDHPGK